MPWMSTWACVGQVIILYPVRSLHGNGLLLVMSGGSRHDRRKAKTFVFLFQYPVGV